MNKHILVTGGAGYIGSHTVLDVLQNGWTPVVLDSYVNSNPESLKRIGRLSNREFPVIEADIRDKDAVRDVLEKYECKAVIHFAGLKAVGESSSDPLKYYDVNVNGTMQLLSAMQSAGCNRIVFSSSATVYGTPKFLPYTEEHPLQAINPYGQTKLAVEHMLRDLDVASDEFKMAILRYFNPVGAHPSGEIGEDPTGVPNNLMPFVAQVAVGRREKLSVFGDDYDTVDGTGVRDYIHVMDLAEAHTRALDVLVEKDTSFTVNLGTGQGVSVLQMIEAFKAASGRDIPYEVAPRRAGDLPEYYADPSYAKEFLNWEASRTLDDMCRDNWTWQSKNPNGY